MGLESTTYPSNRGFIGVQSIGTRTSGCAASQVLTYGGSPSPASPFAMGVPIVLLGFISG